MQPLGRAWLLASCLAVAACHSEGARVILVGRFPNQGPILKAKVELPSSEDPYRFRSELSQGVLSCTLSAKLVDDGPLGANDCAGRKGSGKITCNDGKKSTIEWILTSCRSGFGRSVSRSEQSFVFGFNRDPDRAIDQLEKAENGR